MKNPTLYFSFSFCATLFSSLINASVYGQSGARAFIFREHEMKKNFKFTYIKQEKILKVFMYVSIKL